MREDQPSHTALATGYLRAAHQVLDAPPRVLEDPVAVPVLGEGAADRIIAETARYQAPGARSLRSHVVLRSRFAEDRLAGAAKRGIVQYVLLGAGLDTFAFRQPPWAGRLRIVEIDHPNTQRFKLAMLSRAGIGTPSNVTFGEIDFDRESLLDGLARHGVLPGQPTFFSWLGVTMYLAGDAIDRALHAMGSFAAGSEVVLTFLVPPEDGSARETGAASRLAARTAAAGEPFVSYLRPADVESRLRGACFAAVSFLTPEEATARYYSHGTAGLPPPSRTSIAAAVR